QAPEGRAQRAAGKRRPIRGYPMALDFTFTEEHDELRATIRAFLAEHSDELAVRAQMATERGYDPEVWTLLAEQLGLAGLIIPEVHGGAGMGYVELLVAMEEMGRARMCAPYLGTAVLATNALVACADPVARHHAQARHRRARDDTRETRLTRRPDREPRARARAHHVRARGRAGGRRAALPRDGHRLRQDTAPVRAADRVLSGDQAQVRRHARDGRVRQVGGLRGVLCRRERCPRSARG